MLALGRLHVLCSRRKRELMSKKRGRTAVPEPASGQAQIYGRPGSLTHLSPMMNVYGEWRSAQSPDLDPGPASLESF